MLEFPRHLDFTAARVSILPPRPFLLSLTPILLTNPHTISPPTSIILPRQSSTWARVHSHGAAALLSPLSCRLCLRFQLPCAPTLHEWSLGTGPWCGLTSRKQLWCGHGSCCWSHARRSGARLWSSLAPVPTHPVPPHCRTKAPSAILAGLTTIPSGCGSCKPSRAEFESNRVGWRCVVVTNYVRSTAQFERSFGASPVHRNLQCIPHRTACTRCTLPPVVQRRGHTTAKTKPCRCRSKPPISMCSDGKNRNRSERSCRPHGRLVWSMHNRGVSSSVIEQVNQRCGSESKAFPDFWLAADEGEGESYFGASRRKSTDVWPQHWGRCAEF